MRHILAFLLALGIGVAYSQQPVPTKPVQGNSPEKQTKTCDPNSGNKECAATGGITINVAPSQNVQIPPAPKAEQHDKEAPPEWWLIIPTWLLAVFTAGVFGYTVVLALATKKLVGDAQVTSKRELRAYVGMIVGEIPDIRGTSATYGKD